MSQSEICKLACPGLYSDPNLNIFFFHFSEEKSWHFTSCPDCMCNGHSSCTKDPTKCDQPCQNSTEGEHCEKCAKGFFGSPVNGGTCQACECNGQAEECNHKTGRCHCTTKGIIGEKCQKCDTVNHYFGDPVNGSCYCKFYRPGQPNWEYTMWRFQDFLAFRILREINFGHFEPQKTAILTI